MSLQQFFLRGQTVPYADVPTDCTKQVQTILDKAGLLDPDTHGSEQEPFMPVADRDGIWDENTTWALHTLCQHLKIAFDGTNLSPTQANALLQIRPETVYPLSIVPYVTDDLQTYLAKMIVGYMGHKGYWVARAPNTCNIVYVEGMDRDGRLNADKLNQWNDRRMVIQIQVDGQPTMLVNDQATTEPGRAHTLHPRPANPKKGELPGVARIAFGQYKAWRMDIHRGSANTNGHHFALRQKGRIRLHRDANKDGMRTHDAIDLGDNFGINQHTAMSDNAPMSVDRYSAGCLVGRRYQWHASFLDILKQDARYQNDPNYLFMTTVIAGDDLMKWAGIV